MTELRPWENPPRPSDAEHAVGCWQMAAYAASQHPANARTLWDGEELLAVGGAMNVAGDGYAFVWKRDGLPRSTWRRIMPALIAGLYGCHERGMRRIFAIVAAAHAEGIRLVKRLGFVFVCPEDGWPGTSEPMLRYVRCWPALEEPALVRHHREKLELACFCYWCPALLPAGWSP